MTPLYMTSTVLKCDILTTKREAKQVAVSNKEMCWKILPNSKTRRTFVHREIFV